MGNACCAANDVTIAWNGSQWKNLNRQNASGLESTKGSSITVVVLNNGEVIYSVETTVDVVSQFTTIKAVEIQAAVEEFGGKLELNLPSSLKEKSASFLQPIAAQLFGILFSLAGKKSAILPSHVYGVPHVVISTHLSVEEVGQDIEKHEAAKIIVEHLQFVPTLRVASELIPAKSIPEVLPKVRFYSNGLNPADQVAAPFKHENPHVEAILKGAFPSPGHLRVYLADQAAAKMEDVSKGAFVLSKAKLDKALIVHQNEAKSAKAEAALLKEDALNDFAQAAQASNKAGFDVEAIKRELSDKGASNDLKALSKASRQPSAMDVDIAAKNKKALADLKALPSDKLLAMFEHSNEKLKKTAKFVAPANSSAAALSKTKAELDVELKKLKKGTPQPEKGFDIARVAIPVGSYLKADAEKKILKLTEDLKVFEKQQQEFQDGQNAIKAHADVYVKAVKSSVADLEQRISKAAKLEKDIAQEIQGLTSAPVAFNTLALPQDESSPFLQHLPLLAALPSAVASLRTLYGLTSSLSVESVEANAHTLANLIKALPTSAKQHIPQTLKQSPILNVPALGAVYAHVVADLANDKAASEVALEAALALDEVIPAFEHTSLVKVAELIKALPAGERVKISPYASDLAVTALFNKNLHKSTLVITGEGASFLLVNKLAQALEEQIQSVEFESKAVEFAVNSMKKEEGLEIPDDVKECIVVA